MARKKQQGNGSGTVYPRKGKDGKVASYLGSYFAPDGKRRYVSAKTKTACREKLRRAMSEAANQGFVFDAGKQNVGGYMVRWLEDCYYAWRGRPPPTGAARMPPSRRTSARFIAGVARPTAARGYMRSFAHSGSHAAGGEWRG
jgi:hypothetical protein